MENSNIEWCDHTFNPWIGCTRVSPGCLHCYAANDSPARVARAAGRELWGAGNPRQRTSADYWAKPIRWNLRAGLAAATWREAEGVFSVGTPAPHVPMVFCASQADWLDDEVPIEWLADLLELIHKTPHLVWQLLTKRPQNWRARVCAAGDWMLTHGKHELYFSFLNPWLHATPTPPANVWIGTSVEDQTRADERIPLLLNIPAKVRFLSMEPLLGPVDLAGMDFITAKAGLKSYPFNLPKESRSSVLYGIHWVIVGGESGSKARPMNPAWVFSVRDQCAAAGVPFFFKQWGEWCPGYSSGGYPMHLQNGEKFELPDDESDPSIHCFKATDDEGSFFGAVRVGKVKAGRHLDRVLHDSFPEVSHD